MQQAWEAGGAFHAEERGDKPKFYSLCMFPYPSGRLHMGHVRNYTIGDMLARHRRMRGFNVLQPLGWDAFGLPAENAAIDNGIPPAKWTRDNIDEMRAQLKRLGLAVDWRRELATCDPGYYKWEQQFFVRLFNKGLIYKKKAAVNWDPVDNTVLANEQVVDGRGWRSGAPVERREIPMYFMKITAYADELLAELDNLPGWPESVKAMQRNWIGKSQGARVFFPLKGPGGEARSDALECFSTRPDTLFGATFCAIAPEHPLSSECAKRDPAIAEFIAECEKIGVSEASIEKTEKRGIDTGLRAAHPFEPGRDLPVYVANFVLAQYGTGAIYGCPAHDQRDLEFARAHGLPVIPVVLPHGADAKTFAIEDRAHDGDGVAFNSGFLDGLSGEDAKIRAVQELEKSGRGTGEVQFRLRDWGVSRQRFWGCPVPVVHCPKCGDVAAAEEDLPVLLPEDAAVDGRGSPLARLESFAQCACPKCGGAARREADTLDTFVESSWYFARFASHDCDSAMTDDRAAHWMPVDHYIGGIEHACLHLLYARFFHKLMRDAGMYPAEKKYSEPFANLLCQGMVLNHAFYREENGGRAWVSPSQVQSEDDGKGKITGGRDSQGGKVIYAGRVKMSKSANNGVDPEELVAAYGADTARLFILFAAPPEQSLEWSDEGVRGCARFLNRLWMNFGESDEIRDALRKNAEANGDKSGDPDMQKRLGEARLRLHETLAKADYDMDRLRFNNIPSAAMLMVSNLQKTAAFAAEHARGRDAQSALDLLNEGLSIILRLLAPAVPHIAQELWSRLNLDSSSPFVMDAPWPKADEKVLAARKTVTMAVQVNGKLRAQMDVAADAEREEIAEAARALPAVASRLEGAAVKKTVIVPGRIVNFVL